MPDGRFKSLTLAYPRLSAIAGGACLGVLVGYLFILSSFSERSAKDSCGAAAFESSQLCLYGCSACLLPSLAVVTTVALLHDWMRRWGKNYWGESRLAANTALIVGIGLGGSWIVMRWISSPNGV
jgi:hypothetical protein